MDRTALVTGASGFIAAHLVPRLLDDGWSVRAGGRRPRPDTLPDAVDYRRADLTEAEAVAPLVKGVSHLFHLAGASSTSASSEEDLYRSNVVATENLLAAALDAGVERVFYMSSTSVYGEEEQLPTPVTEDTEPHPSRGYGKAKWATEQVVRRCADRGLPSVVMRPVTVYGPGNTKLLASAILDASIERFAGCRALAVHAQPVEQRLVHIADLVAATVHLMEHDDAVGRTFNLTSGLYPSNHDIAAIVAGELGMERELSDDPDCGLDYDERRRLHEEMVGKGMSDDIVLTEKRFRFMRKENRNNRVSIDALLGTGFELQETDLHSGIARTVDWYRQRRWIL